MTGQTKVFISRNLVTVLSDLFFHIFVNLTITIAPIAILNYTIYCWSAGVFCGRTDAQPSRKDAVAYANPSAVSGPQTLLPTIDKRSGRLLRTSNVRSHLAVLWRGA